MGSMLESMLPAGGPPRRPPTGEPADDLLLGSPAPAPGRPSAPRAPARSSFLGGGPSGGGSNPISAPDSGAARTPPPQARFLPPAEEQAPASEDFGFLLTMNSGDGSSPEAEDQPALDVPGRASGSDDEPLPGGVPGWRLRAAGPN